MANVREQNFDSGSNGTLLGSPTGSAGLDYAIVTYPTSGGVEYSTGYAHSGTLSMRCFSGATAGAAQGRYNFTSTTTRFFRYYAKLTALPAATLATWRVRTGTTTVASIRITSTGGFQLTDPATAIIGTSTAGGIISAGTLFRIELGMAATAIDLRVFTGANIEGTTPDATISGTIAGTAFDNVIEGYIGSTASFEMFVDDAAHDDATWVGPYVAPPTSTVTYQHAVVIG